jgi:hypothetical protein
MRVEFGGMTSVAVAPVRQSGRSSKLTLAADAHAFDTFVPSLDGLPFAGTKIKGSPSATELTIFFPVSSQSV